MTMERTLPERIADGRAVSRARRVRWGDVDRHGRFRLDAAARYLQDIADDDSHDAGLRQDEPWIVRSTFVEIVQAPALGEHVEVTTFAAGAGARWAERRTTMTGSAGGAIEASAIWVHVDPATGAPARLTDGFHQLWGSAVAGRKVSGRLTHDAEPPEGAVRTTWPLRSVDYDPLGHLNNAATWTPIEHELDRRELIPRRAELEFRSPIGRGDVAEVVVAATDDHLDVWVYADDALRATARIDVEHR